MSDKWILTVPVISSAHLQERTFAALVGDIMRGRAAGAAGPDQLYMFVPEAAPEQPDLYAVCAWARDEGHEYIRLDAHGDKIDSLPTYDWEIDRQDEPATYHRYDLSTQADGTLSGQAETNDDNDDGVPDDDIERWEVNYENRERALKITGGSHIGMNGCSVVVFIDGVRV